MIQVELPNGSIMEAANTDTPLDIAGRIGSRLQSAVLAAQLNDTIVDAARPFGDLFDDGAQVKLRLLTDKDAAALGVLRHSAAHVMARAVMRLYPDVQLAFGPTTANGFYYDFDLPRPLGEGDFAAIEAEMKQVIDRAEPFERFDLSRDKALEFVGGLKQAFKSEHIQTGLAGHASLGFYRQGEFVDLCRGPHIPDAGRIKAFKVVSVAGRTGKETPRTVRCSDSTAQRSSARKTWRRIWSRWRRPSGVTTAFSGNGWACFTLTPRSVRACACGYHAGLPFAEPWKSF